MKQKTFAEIEYDNKKRKTRREVFLSEMEQVVPWKELVSLIEPYYPLGLNGRPVKPLEQMLRIYCCQKWFSQSDPGMEDMIYDSVAVRRFVGIDLIDNGVPDESTILKFRHLLEEHDLARDIFDHVNRKLEKQGFIVKSGTIVDATIIAAAPSTKNEKKERDPEMHQTQKGNQWYFGMKVHVGADTQHGLVHSLETTSANVHDSQVMDLLLHGKEKELYGDSAYSSAAAKDVCESQGVKWKVHHKRKKGTELTQKQERENKSRSKVRAKGEHAFLVVKRIWGNSKARYRGLKKNTDHFLACFALANLYMVRQKIMRLQGSCAW